MSKIFLSIFAIYLSIVPLITYGASTDLQSEIEARNRELEAVSKQILEAQATLQATSAKGNTLKQEIGNIDKNIKNVTLGIKQSEIVLDKLGLEIVSIGRDIVSKEQSLNSKKIAVESIIQNMQAKDNENLLISFLQNKSLTSSLLEAQTLVDMNEQLLNEVATLREIKNELVEKKQVVAEKKDVIEDEKNTLKVKKSLAEEEKQARANILESTKNQEKIYQQQLAELEKKQQAISDEIDKIETELRTNYDSNLLPSKRAGVFRNPLENPRMTQAYGATSFAKSNGRYYPKGTHNGMDFAAPLGTPVYAAADGTVTLSSKNGTSAERFYYGKYVLLKHANNLSTIYGHLSRQAVSNGQVVKKGDVIGYVGKTGYATGYHVHFGVLVTDSIKLNNVSGAGIIPAAYTLNPADYL